MVLFSTFTKAIVLCSVFALKASAQSFDFPPVTPEQAKAARKTMVEYSQGADNQTKLAQDVDAASDAAVGIAQNFTKIGQKLLSIDNKGLQDKKFFPTWQGYRDTYFSLLQDTHNLAAAVATYTDEFNHGILQLVNNSDISNATKITTLNSFIAISQGFQNQSSNLTTQFRFLTSNITEFTGEFRDFAVNRTADDNKEIEGLLDVRLTVLSYLTTFLTSPSPIQDIGKLQAEMAKLEASMIALASAMGAVLLGTGAALVFFPEFAFAIVIGAAIAEGILTAAEIGLVTAYSVDSNKLGGLQRQVQTVRDEISLINSTQSALNSTRDNDIPALVAHITLITQVWSDVASDCTDIVGWLTGARDMPIFWDEWLTNGVTIYDSMSIALRDYATRVQFKVMELQSEEYVQHVLHTEL
ncbi:hypothetical protein BC834DRAFT_300268 [Gloeopeniophorella convolvens]|nr:hypothetical protein BC834DRAFT_300268 [Gloeopeniophorella convolvens]